MNTLLAFVLSVSNHLSFSKVCNDVYVKGHFQGQAIDISMLQDKNGLYTYYHSSLTDVKTTLFFAKEFESYTFKEFCTKYGLNCVITYRCKQKGVKL